MVLPLACTWRMREPCFLLVVPVQKKWAIDATATRRIQAVPRSNGAFAHLSKAALRARIRQLSAIEAFRHAATRDICAWQAHRAATSNQASTLQTLGAREVAPWPIFQECCKPLITQRDMSKKAAAAAAAADPRFSRLAYDPTFAESKRSAAQRKVKVDARFANVFSDDFAGERVRAACATDAARMRVRRRLPG